MDATCVLLRYGEIAIKSNRKRPYFEKKYTNAIREALGKHGISGELENAGGRFILHTEHAKEAARALQDVPGIQTLSPAKHVTFTSKDDLVSQLKTIAEPLVAGKTFRITAKRVGQHPFRSIDIKTELGKTLEPSSNGVDLENPELSLHVEIRDNSAYLYTEKKNGLSGLPPGTAGNVLCLFSGGIDSPVAAYTMLKKGCNVDFLIVNLLSEHSIADAVQVYNYLITRYAHCYTPTLTIVNVDAEELKKRVPDRLRQIAFKQALYTIAEKIAQEKHAALVTGEALSQKSSQTVHSLAAISTATTLPVLRPLIGLDKLEIIRIAEKIGTLHYSEKIKEYCQLSEGPVTTKPTAHDLERIPDLRDLIEKAVNSAKTITGIHDVKKEEQPTLNLPDIIVVDIRHQHARDAHGLDVDIALNYEDALDYDYGKEKSYVFICQFGVLSEDLAHRLREKGYRAAGMSVRDFEKYLKNMLATH